MRILIGCDVDPILPPLLKERPDSDIWKPLDHIPPLLELLGEDMPTVTWLIRADETVKFCTGTYDSGFSSRRPLWEGLLKDGHELGWHMHLLSYDRQAEVFRFDPEPSWLPAAHGALVKHYAVKATRTGWDYGSNFLMGKLDELGVRVDFSALPGNIAWFEAGGDAIVVDWVGCEESPYNPSRGNYKRSGAEALRLLEVPVAQFPNSIVGIAKRYAWRLRHRYPLPIGLHKKTKLLTQRWDGLPRSKGEVWAFYFHPEDLTEPGTENFVVNIRKLRELTDAEFITATGINS